MVGYIKAASILSILASSGQAFTPASTSGRSTSLLATATDSEAITFDKSMSEQVNQQEHPSYQLKQSSVQLKEIQLKKPNLRRTVHQPSRMCMNMLQSSVLEK